MYIKYFSDNDLSLSWSLKESEGILLNYDANYEFNGINDVLEKYNVFLVMKSGSKLDNWGDSFYNKLSFTANQMKSKIFRYISNININDLNCLYSDIYKLYEEDFWELLVQTDKIKEFSNEQFSDLINQNGVRLTILLSIKKIVELFDKELQSYIIKDVNKAEVIIDILLRYRNYRDKKVYLPKSLSKEAKMELISEYVNSSIANPNYLLLISQARNEKDFPISDRIRLNAKNNYDRFFDENNLNDSGIKIEIHIGYANIDEDIVDSSSFNKQKFIYSRNWLRENLDNATLLNNFIYVFEFTDMVFRAKFPSKKIEIGSLESVIGINGKREYKTSMYFNLKENITDLQTFIYYEELTNFDKSLEKLYKWFFEEYLVREFNAEGFFLNIPSDESVYIEKIRMLCPEFDNVLNQFSMFVKEGKIDKELIDISRNTERIESVPSFCKDKYGYITDQDLLHVSDLLFSDQSILAYIPDHKIEFNTFYEIIINNKVKILDFLDYQRGYLELLLADEIICEDTNKYIYFNLDAVTVLKDFYKNEVLCITYYENKFLENLIKDKKVITEGTLFSRPEQNYLSFILNDQEYNNGYSLRNKYLHGRNTQNKEQHRNDYFKLLKLFALLIIKINEEFCRRDDSWGL